MGKKSIGRHGAKPAFRESDFAGRPPQEQTKLSGSFNQLSQQIAATRRLLMEFEDHAARRDGALRLDPTASAPPPADGDSGKS